jgi:peptidylprolyl isomerase
MVRWSLGLLLVLAGSVGAIPVPEKYDTPPRPGRVTTPSGLQYEDLEVGKGPEVKVGDQPQVHYTGTFTDQKKFDSSRDRQQPFVFKLGDGQVIKGMDEGVVGMKVGGKRKLTIPPNLAYGEKGVGPIPANSTLIFEIELLGIGK